MNKTARLAWRFALDDVVQAHLAVKRGEKIGHVILNISQAA